MRKRVYVVIIALCFIFAACAAWAGYPMRVKDCRGKTIVIKAKPMRIISIAPSNTEILYALGLSGRIVGVTKYCDYPKAAKSKPKVGDMTTSAETVIALKPDLVLAHGMLNSTTIPRLEKLGVTVFAVDPKTLCETARDIRTIGKITGRPKTANIVAAKIDDAIKSVKVRSAKKPVRKVLVVIQSNPLWAAGPKTFVNEMLGIAHAKNVASDARPGFVPFSKELAISRNPDVIITGQHDDINYFIKSPEWRTTNVVKHKRIYVIDSDIILRAGPRLAEGLKVLAGKIN